MGRIRKDIAEDREREAWRLRLQGWTQENIAVRLGCDQSTICTILKRITKKLHTEFVEEVAEIKATQAAQLEEIYRTAMEQWERSCEDKDQVRIVSGRVKPTEMGFIELPDMETHTQEGQTGNPALLAQAMKAKADIRAIYGMDAPVKQEIAGSGGGPVVITEVIVEKTRRGDE